MRKTRLAGSDSPHFSKKQSEHSLIEPYITPNVRKQQQKSLQTYHKAHIRADSQKILFSPPPPAAH